MQKRELTQEFKEYYNIENLIHSAQSSDLNSIEGIWAIIKQRIARRIFDSEEEMKEGLQEE